MKKAIVFTAVVALLIGIASCTKEKINPNNQNSDWVYSEFPPSGYDGAPDVRWDQIPVGGSPQYVVFPSNPTTLNVAWEKRGIPAVPGVNGNKYYGPVPSVEFPQFLRENVSREFVAGRRYVILSRVMNPTVSEEEAWRIDHY